MRAYTFQQDGHTVDLVEGDDYYRLERDDGFRREVRRARQNDNVESPYLLLTERSIHPTELADFRQGIWRAIYDLAA